MNKYKATTIFLAGMMAGVILFLTSITLQFPLPTKTTELYLRIVYKYIRELYPNELPDNNKFQYGAVKGFVQALKDPHSAFLTPEENHIFESPPDSIFGIGIEIEISNYFPKIADIDSNQTGYKAGLRKNDYIFSVNGEKTQNLSIIEIALKIWSIKNDSVAIAVMREDEPGIQTFKIQRKLIKLKKNQTQYKIVGKIVIINYPQFEEEETINLLAIVRKISNNDSLKGIIFDLRNNPGGQLSLCRMVAGLWLTSDKLLATIVNKNNVTKKIYPMPLLGNILTNNPKPPFQKFKTVILLNKGSASASELLSATLQDYNLAKIIGSRTFGKGSVQSHIPINEGMLIITRGRYLRSNSKEVNGIGVFPDIFIKNEKGNAVDLQMQKALEWLRLENNKRKPLAKDTLQ